MSLIRKKQDKKPHEHGLRAFALLLRALVAQRVARKAYRGYRWTRRLPFIAAGAAVIAFVVRKTQQKTGGASDAGAPTPSSTSTSTSSTPSASSAPASTPSTPTPTGSPTAVTPAPTATADGAAEPEPES